MKKVMICPKIGSVCVGAKCVKLASCTDEEISALYNMHLDEEAKRLTEAVKKIIRGEK